MNIKIKYHTIPIWERKGFFGRLQVTQEYKDFQSDELTLLKVLTVLEKKRKLSTDNKEIIRVAMKNSHEAMGAEFRKRYPYAAVADISFILDQLL